MKEWFTIPELADAKLPGLPTSVRRIHDHADRAGWDHQPGKSRAIAKRGGGREFHYSLLPPEARQKIAFLNADLTAPVKGVSKHLWSRFEALTDEHKAICRKRLDVLIAVDDMKASGIAATAAVQHCARMADIAVTTLYGWRQMVEGHARADWLAALAPAFSPVINGLVADRADCHADAWATLRSDYLRPEKPKFSSCFRRMISAAKANGWSPIPSERSLRRRLEAEVPKAVQILARDGKEAAARLFPAQTRSVDRCKGPDVPMSVAITSEDVVAGDAASGKNVILSLTNGAAAGIFTYEVFSPATAYWAVDSLIETGAEVDVAANAGGAHVFLGCDINTNNGTKQAWDMYATRGQGAGPAEAYSLSLKSEVEQPLAGAAATGYIASAVRVALDANASCVIKVRRMWGYLDPPYFGNEGDYGVGLFSRDQFEVMTDRLARLKGNFVLSINDTAQTRELFGRFDVVDVDLLYSVAGGKGTAARELIVKG